MKNLTKEKIIEFITQSNLIEGIGEEGFEDSLKAFEYIMQVQTPLTRKHILKTHQLLMKSLNPRIAGKIRTCNVRVGARVCPPIKMIPEKMHAFLYIINATITKERSKERYSKISHVDFELMHPFEDGNGRTGRLLMNWHRKQMGLPLLIIKDAEKHNYYNWFK